MRWNLGIITARSWSADVEMALKELGCPQWMKPPKKGQGFAAVCSGHADGKFQSETVTPGHVAVYGPIGSPNSRSPATMF